MSCREDIIFCTVGCSRLLERWIVRYSTAFEHHYPRNSCVILSFLTPILEILGHIHDKHVFVQTCTLEYSWVFQRSLPLEEPFDSHKVRFTGTLKSWSKDPPDFIRRSLDKKITNSDYVWGSIIQFHLTLRIWPSMTNPQIKQNPKTCIRDKILSNKVCANMNKRTNAVLQGVNKSSP